MKRIILTLILLLSICISALAQRAEKITLEMSNVSIEKVIARIEKESGLKFSYSRTLVDLSTVVSVNVKDASIDEVLAKVLQGTNITYKKADGQIVLVAKVKEIASADSKKASAPVKCQVKGVVTDSKGEPLIGTVVMVPGTSIIATTDFDGKYTITVDSGSTIEFSQLGFKTVSRIIAKDSEINIKLQDDRELLDEVVVIGYGTISKKDLSTAVSSVKADKVSKIATTNMSSMLLGRASGVNGTLSNPQPDGKVNISIRAGGNPLYVVDGIVMPSSSMDVEINSGTKLPNSVQRSPISGINPNDIETIEILKDASASIYGIGASDGVIIITTKKGASGKPTISYDGSFTYAVNKKFIDILDAEQFMKVNNVFNRENYLYANGMYPYGTKTYDGGWSPLFSDEQIANNKINTDWVSKVLRNGYTNSHSISINGGSEKIKYYLSASYFGQQGVVVNSDLQKFIIHSNVTAELFPFLKLNTVINYNNNKYGNSSAGADSGSGAHTYGAYQSAVNYSPLLEERDANGKWSQYKNMPNPVAMLGISDKSKQQTIYANFTLDADIIKNMLTAKVVYGFNSVMSSRDYYIPTDIYFNEMYRSRGEVGSMTCFDQTVEGTVSFNHKFGDYLKIDAVAGFGFYFKHQENHSTYYENTNDKIGNDKINLAAGPFYPKTSKSGSQRRSQFIRANFVILNRYVISLAFRNDGSDKFFKGKKYAQFPSVSAAWKINNENFMKNVRWLDQLKLRASYGITGRDNLGSSLFGLYTPNSVYISFAGSQFIPFYQSSQDSPYVTWETTRMADVALDFSFLDEKISGSFDWFRYDETNQLSYDPESIMSQFSSHPVNAGHYARTGFDFSLTGRPIQTKDIAWEITANLSRAKAYWIEREPNYQYKSYQIRDKEPLHPYYYYKQVGIINVDRSNMPQSQTSLPAEWQMPGVSIIKDKNGDGVINEEDVYCLDDSEPKIYGGIGTNFRWKGLELDVYFYGRLGRQKWDTAVSLGSVGEAQKTDPKNMSVAVFDAFSSLTNPWDATRCGVARAKCPSLPGGLGDNADCYDASFLRCKNITVSYTFNSDQLKAAGKWINSIRLYLDTQNPFLITKYPYEDPEITSYGGQSSTVTYPQSVSFTFGTKIVF